MSRYRELAHAKGAFNMELSPSADREIFEAVKCVVAPRLVRICAWCPDALERTRAALATGAQVTHGMCPACEAMLDAADVA